MCKVEVDTDCNVKNKRLVTNTYIKVMQCNIYVVTLLEIGEWVVR